MAEQPALLNYAKLSGEYLAMVIENALALHGWNARVSRATPVDSDDTSFPSESTIEEFYGEVRHGEYEEDEFKVLLGEEGLTGVQIPDYISLTDKIEDTIVLISLFELHSGDRVDVRTPEDETITLQIVNEPNITGTTRASWSYEAIPV